MTSKKLEEDLPQSLESNTKSTVAQCCALSVPTLLTLSFGMSIGFLTVMISELYKEDAEIIVTEEELTWISSINYFLIPLGSLAAGPLVDLVGRKLVMFLSAVAFVLGWAMLHWWATNASTLLLGFALLGFAGGVINPSGHTYTSEISEIRYRGVMLTFLMLIFYLGLFLQILIGYYVYWRTFALVNLILPALGIVAIFIIPESPQWLANRGRLSDAERSLRWLRGWTNPGSMKREFDILIQASTIIKTVEPDLTFCERFTQRYFRRVVVLPFLMLTFSFIVSAFNGFVVLQTYSVLVFERIEAPIDEYTATIMLGGLTALGPVSLILIIKRTGKRLPTLLSLIITGSSLFGVALFTYLRERNIIQQDTGLSWIPMTLVLLSVFSSTGGIESSPWLVASEIFPVEVRGVAIGILVASYNIFDALMNKTFLYMLEGFTLPGTFIFYTAVNILGGVVLYWAMPETEGKTLIEIQKFFLKKDRTHEDEERAARVNQAMEPI